MNHDSATPLDSFETALLAQLKSIVTETAVAGPAEPAAPGPSPTRRRRAWYASIAAMAAAALAAILAVHGLWPTPAYAVSGRNNGEVRVRVMRLEGADRLERALSDRGIPADITYLPAGKQCAPGRYTAVRTPGLSLTVSSDDFRVTIPPGAVGADDTFVLSAAVVPIPNGFRASVDFDIAHGPVAPCRIVDGP